MLTRARVDLGLHADRHDELPVDVADLGAFPGRHLQRLQVLVEDVAMVSDP